MNSSDWEESLEYEREHCEHCERSRKYGSGWLCESHRSQKNLKITGAAIREAVRRASEAQKRRAASREESSDTTKV